VQFAAAASNTTANATADASARVVSPISITPSVFASKVLNFGRVVPTGTAGTVEINATTGDRTATDVDTLGNGVSAPAFNVSGEPNESFVVSYPDNFTIDSGSGDTMEVEMFIASSLLIPPPTNTLTLPDSGLIGISIGATLKVGATQAAGDYSKDFNVTVTYQ